MNSWVTIQSQVSSPDGHVKGTPTTLSAIVLDKPGCICKHFELVSTGEKDAGKFRLNILIKYGTWLNSLYCLRSLYQFIGLNAQGNRRSERVWPRCLDPLPCTRIDLQRSSSTILTIYGQSGIFIQMPSSPGSKFFDLWISWDLNVVYNLCPVWSLVDRARRCRHHDFQQTTFLIE